jgi:pimeloyl-ACP methyl ester carboxylesterase
MKKNLIYLLTFLLIFYSCTSDDEVVTPPSVKKETLVESKVVKKISSAEVTAIYNALTKDLPQDKVPPVTLEGVTVYKLTYKTDYPGKNDKILASGALVVPDNIPNNHIVSYQHGTITDAKEIPSLFANTEQNNFIVVLSAFGFYVSVPDYLGYGDSSSEFHLYEHGASLASSSYDMLLASREFLFSEKRNVGNKLFLSGYSEGGYATMALHQHIEQEGKLTVTASAPGAGAYNKSNFALEVLSKNEDLPFIRSYLWVLATYNYVYGINKPWSYYLNEPYASAIDVKNPLSVFTASISANPSKLFTQTFRDEVRDKKDTPFNKALKDNDRFDWKADAPVKLYYGTADNYVYPSNSTTAYTAMKAKGSTVELVPFKDKDHFTAADSYGISVLLSFFAQK